MTLAEDRDEGVRSAVASNSSTLTNTLCILFNDKSESVSRPAHAALSLKLPLAVFLRFQEASNPNTSTERLYDLLCDGISLVSTAAALNLHK